MYSASPRSSGGSSRRRSGAPATAPASRSPSPLIGCGPPRG
jgi:hypothetical protein